MKLPDIGRPSLMRDLNYRAVLELIAQEGPLSRAELAYRLTLSRPSVSRVVEGLIQAGYVEEGSRVASKTGRPQVLLDINPKAGTVAGLDVRSSKARLVLADLKGHPLLQMQVNTETRSPEALVDQLIDLLAEARSEESPLAVSVGISGAWDEKSRRVYAAPNLAFLEDIDLLGLLEAQLESTILLDNDVNFAALGEYTYGIAAGCDDFFYLNLGSGIGGGAVVHGRLHQGIQGFAGEIGYLPVHYHGVPLEQLASRTVVSERARRLGLDDAAALFERARSGDEAATLLVAEISRYIALGLCAVVTTLNPPLIVIGGSMGRYSDVLIPHLKAALARFLPLPPRIKGTALAGDASLRGAVARAMELARAHLIANLRI